MGDIRKKYDAALKARIALEAVKGDKTIREISSEYGIHSSQIMKWKKQLLEELPSIFSDKRAKTEKEREDLEAESYCQILCMIHQAASSSSRIPSTNFTPCITSARRETPSNFLHPS